MTKELILLATSKKYGKYCVAGIDTTNGQWYRLVTTNSDAHYAIDAKDLILDNGEMAKKLDVVQLELVDKAVTYFQSENYIIRKNAPWHKVRDATIQEVTAIHPPNRDDFIFYDTCRKLSRSFYAGLNYNQVHSLLLITPDRAKVQIIEQENSRRVLLQLVYKNRNYEPLPVTDFEFIALCSSLHAGLYPMQKKGIMLCSVGECFERDQHHYKLVAGIMLE